MAETIEQRRDKLIPSDCPVITVDEIIHFNRTRETLNEITYICLSSNNQSPVC